MRPLLVSSRVVLVVVAVALCIRMVYLTGWIRSIIGVNVRFRTDPTPDPHRPHHRRVRVRVILDSFVRVILDTASGDASHRAG